MGAPNFTLLDSSLPEIGRRSWSHPQEPTGEEWWADVLSDPRARKRERRTDLAVKRAFYRLADEKREIILVACSKCDWRAAFSRDDLIAAHGADYAMPNLLNHLAAPSCSRLGSQWDRCGVHYSKNCALMSQMGHECRTRSRRSSGACLLRSESDTITLQSAP